MSNLLLPNLLKRPVSRDLLTLPEYVLYFSSRFNSLSFDNFASLSNWNKITGTDSETGQVWDGKSATYPNGNSGNLATIFTGVNLLNDITQPINSSNHTSYGASTVINAAGPDGPNENIMRLELLDSGKIPTGNNSAFGGQIWLGFLRIASSTSPLPADISPICITYYCKLGTFVNNLTDGQIQILINLKTGGYNGSYGGDSRLTARIVRVGSSLRFQLAHDHGANGADAGITVTPYGATFPNSASDGGYYHWMNTNSNVDVPVDTWFKLEMWVDHTGWAMLAIDDAVVIVQKGVTIGEYELPFGRLFVAGVYTDHAPANGSVGQVDLCRMDISNYPAAGSVLRQEILNRLF